MRIILQHFLKSERMQHSRIKALNCLNKYNQYQTFQHLSLSPYQDQNAIQCLAFQIYAVLYLNANRIITQLLN